MRPKESQRKRKPRRDLIELLRQIKAILKYDSTATNEAIADATEKSIHTIRHYANQARAKLNIPAVPAGRPGKRQLARIALKKIIENAEILEMLDGN